jgi:hypothetical protein
MEESAKTNEGAERARARWVERAFKNPTAGMVGLAASIISVPLAIYLFVAGQEKPDLTYLVRPDRTSIVAAGDTPDITIAYKGQELTKNVSAAQIEIWNAGKRPIRSEDVLTDYVISVQTGHPIVTAKVILMTDPVTEFRLDESKIQDGQLRISWRVLEHNDGALVQVIYEGDTSVPIQLSGVSIGQRSVNLHSQGFRRERSVWIGVGRTLLVALLILTTLSLGGLTYVQAMGLRGYRGRSAPLFEWFFCGALVLGCAVAASFTAYMFIAVLNPSPFG